MEDLAVVFGKAGNKSDFVLLEAGSDLSCVAPAQGTLGQGLGTMSVPAKSSTDSIESNSQVFTQYVPKMYF